MDISQPRGGQQPLPAIPAQHQQQQQQHQQQYQQQQQQQQQQQFPATFPETFRNYFSMLNDEEDDHVELFSNILEDKVIPRHRHLPQTPETPANFDPERQLPQYQTASNFSGHHLHQQQYHHHPHPQQQQQHYHQSHQSHHLHQQSARYPHSRTAPPPQQQQTSTSPAPTPFLGRSSSFRHSRTRNSLSDVLAGAKHSRFAQYQSQTFGAPGSVQAQRQLQQMQQQQHQQQQQPDGEDDELPAQPPPVNGPSMLRRRSSVLGGFNISDDEKRRKHFAQLAEAQRDAEAVGQQKHNRPSADDDDSDTTVSTTSSSGKQHQPTSEAAAAAGYPSPAHHHHPAAVPGQYHLQQQQQQQYHHQQQQQSARSSTGNLQQYQHQHQHQRRPSVKRIIPPSTTGQQLQHLGGGAAFDPPHPPHPQHTPTHPQQQFFGGAARRSPSLTSVRLQPSPSATGTGSLLPAASGCAVHGAGKAFAAEKINKLCSCSTGPAMPDLHGARSPVAVRRRAASLIASASTATSGISPAVHGPSSVGSGGSGSSGSGSQQGTTLGFAFLMCQQQLQQQQQNPGQPQQLSDDSGGGGISANGRQSPAVQQQQQHHLRQTTSVSTTELLHSRFKSSNLDAPTTAGPHPLHTPTTPSAGGIQRQRQRTSSMPVENRKPRLADTRRSAIHCGDVDLEYYRLRSFSITSHGICNLGDSMRKRRSRSITSVSSSQGGGGGADRGRHGSNASQLGADGMGGAAAAGGGGEFDEDGEAADGGKPGADDEEKMAYKVAMLGAGGVGKTALTYQFTTSEYICAYDLSLDDDYGQKTVSVMLDDQETDLEIIDHPASEMSTESFCSTYNIDHFVVVYSVVDRRTFKAAEQILHYLRDSEMLLTRGAILVGNKTDLERHREVTRNAGRHLAKEVACKFIETSSGLDHNVNELLVGIVAQVKLNPQRIRNLSDKQKLALAAAGSAAMSTTSLLQQKQRLEAARTVATTAREAGATGDDDAEAGLLGTTVEARPAPRTGRENQLFTAGGRPFGQRVVLSIRQQPNSAAGRGRAEGMGPSSGSTDDECGGVVAVEPGGSVEVYAAGDAENTSPRRMADCGGGAGAGGAAGGSGSGQQPVVAVVAEKPASPASRISMRTKYLLTSLMKFKRTLRAKRRNSSSCSDLFVI